MNKIVIKNAIIVDGTKKEPYKGTVVVKNQRIHSIKKGENITEGSSHIIDGKSLILAPGFIDTHSHSDLEILEKKVIEPKIRQGITSEILGQDGIAMAPLPIQHIEDWRKNIGGLEGESDNIDWEYESIEGYLNSIEEQEPTNNVAYLIPHGNVRMAAMGLDNLAPDQEQLEAMKSIVREGMEHGCVGLSSGLIYVPCAYSEEYEIIELCKVVAEYEGVFVVHQRSEANQIIESMDEIFRIGLASGVKIHFSHFKLCGVNNYHLFESVIEKLEEGKKMGLEISFDQYPYTAGSTMLGVILPPKIHDGGTEKMLERLKDEDVRKQLKEEMLATNCEWDNFIEFAGLDGIYITSVKNEKNKKVIGKNLKEVGQLFGKDPLDATFDLLIQEENSVGIIDYYGHEEHIKQFIQRDEMNVCTDGLLSGMPHPRAYGSFPKIISDYVRKEKLLTIEEAIHKMTYRPAKLFGLKDRGIIREGAFADMILFDAETLEYSGSYTDPKHFPKGLKMVMVNGHILFNGEEYDIEPCGKVLNREIQRR